MNLNRLKRAAGVVLVTAVLATGCAQASAHSRTDADAPGSSVSASDDPAPAPDDSGPVTPIPTPTTVPGAGTGPAQTPAPQQSQQPTAGKPVAKPVAKPVTKPVKKPGAKPVTKPGTGPDAAGSCPTNLGRIACVNLSKQIMWVQVGRKVIFGPVHIRSGRKGYVTRTGLWHIYWRDEHHWSTIYDVAMPYSQFFSGGEAFHGLNGESMSTPPGSHGCVNMNTWDARTLWGILKKGDPVKIFGRKPGT